MNANDVLGEVLEKGQSAVKNSAKSSASSAAGLAKTAAGQIAGENSQADNSSDRFQTQQQADADKAATEELVKDLYAKSKDRDSGSQVPKTEREMEDKQKLEKLRQELHGQYYQGLTDRPKVKEERSAEKVEREKKQEMVDLQEKEKKKPPALAVQRAQQSTEKFRGVSG